ncbi:MAG TPA: hypothetical protein VIW26_03415, partial [Gemmatimonadales bacterium]
MIRRSLVPSLVILLPACASVQGDAAAVVPGLAIHFDATATPDTIVYQRSITRAGQDSAAGTRTVVLQVV